MERGIYFDGWYKHNYCYHPSLPMRNQQMLEDLEAYHGTILAWAGLGGGSISLPFLQHEAFGEVDPRMQLYGFMNDSEFIEECSRRGILLFGIVFEVQGWEFPVVMDSDGHIVRMNRRAEKNAALPSSWYGLREFSRNTWPAAFSTKLEDYYPDGIRDENGDPVTDLLEECCTRDRFGNPIHAQWVEIKGHAEQCLQMCRNNPVWREYLKKIIEIQIDAGVPGIQLDECELPMTSISSGGCFCKSCMKQFTAWLKERKTAGKLGPEWNDIDLDAFHYGAYLTSHGFTFPENAPFYRDYWEFQVRQVREYFSELADYAREYAMRKHGRRLLISGNFYNMQPVYYPIESKVDIVITEMEHTLFRQPYYYRYCAGFAPEKPVIIAENPYGGIIPALLNMLDRGKGYDLYRIFLLEASMYGCNMSVPYGGWMGNTIQDAFWPPRALTTEIQHFLKMHEGCYPQPGIRNAHAVPRKAPAGAAVLYSYGSCYWRDSNKGSGANGMQDSFGTLLDATADEWLDPDLKPVPFWECLRAMSDCCAQYDVLMLPDGDLRADDFTADRLAGYPLLIAPDCFALTQNQQDLLLAYAKNGGRLLIIDRIAEGTSLAEKLTQTGNAVRVCLSGDSDKESRKACFLESFHRLYDPVSPVEVECTGENIGIQRYDIDGHTYIHLMNYNYDAKADRIAPLKALEIRARGVAASCPDIITLPSADVPTCEISHADDRMIISLKNVGLYTILCF